jgi:hypothetical protein
MGANCVRVALRWHGLYGSDPATDSRDDQAYAFLRRANVAHWLDLISAVSAAGMWVVPFIDSNCVQSGTQDPAQQAYCDPYGAFGARGRNGYTDASLRRLFTSIVWPAAAARLRVIPRIAMLEIHPSPRSIAARSTRPWSPCCSASASRRSARSTPTRRF